MHVDKRENLEVCWTNDSAISSRTGKLNQCSCHFPFSQLGNDLSVVNSFLTNSFSVVFLFSIFRLNDDDSSKKTQPFSHQSDRCLVGFIVSFVILFLIIKNNTMCFLVFLPQVNFYVQQFEIEPLHIGVVTLRFSDFISWSFRSCSWIASCDENQSRDNWVNK